MTIRITLKYIPIRNEFKMLWSKVWHFKFYGLLMCESLTIIQQPHICKTEEGLIYRWLIFHCSVVKYTRQNFETEEKIKIFDFYLPNPNIIIFQVWKIVIMHCRSYEIK